MYLHYEPYVRAFVARRLSADEVDDVVSAVFLTAWRRRADLPDDALPWLYRTARNLVGNQYRSRERLMSLTERLAVLPTPYGVDPGEVAGDRRRAVEAFDALEPNDQEILLLAAWDGLSPTEIGAVLGVLPANATVRLYRARRRFEAAHESLGTERSANEEVSAIDDRRTLCAPDGFGRIGRRGSRSPAGGPPLPGDCRFQGGAGGLLLRMGSQWPRIMAWNQC